MHHNHNFGDRYFANNDPSVFVIRVVRVKEVQLECIGKHMAGIGKVQPVFGNVALFFLHIPFKLKVHHLNTTKILEMKKSETRMVTEESTTACLADAPTPSAPPRVFRPM